MGLPSIRRDDRVIWWFLKEKGKEGYVVLGVGDDTMMLLNEIQPQSQLVPTNQIPTLDPTKAEEEPAPQTTLPPVRVGATKDEPSRNESRMLPPGKCRANHTISTQASLTLI
ncbi:hypothetical protein F2Q70_00037170 [Brassica cretica]|uniref:Uncharacterized protein n=1 Tax=Brassica cretica TaxID=69181 RepID=A0A8S9JQD9_BRACR|nr:hypothetical protein F2Q70_00037170 [Brassica cretica]